MARADRHFHDQMTAAREAEEFELRKADADIAAGRRRLSEQEQLVLALRTAGEPSGEAERLAALFRGTLAEWERHRELIVQRLAYLAASLYEEPGT